MKKILLLVLLSILPIWVFSQNFIGYSIKDVWEYFDSRGYIIQKGWTDDGKYFYLSASDKERSKVYYFTESNICFLFSIVFYDISRSDIIKILNSIGYKQISSDEFINDDTRCNIIFLDDHGYSIVISPRNKNESINWQ